MGDHCEEGVCIGKPIVCDDGDPCTDDACSGLGDCVHTNNQADCDDGDPCTVADQCKNGACAGTTVNCACQKDSACAVLEDGNLCNGMLFCDLASLPYLCKVEPASVVVCPTPSAGPDAICLKASCDPATGGCSLVPDHEGMACSDGNACTLGDACVEGACVSGTAAQCKDDNPCTDDACLPETGCSFVPNTAACDDGDICTVGDLCADGACLPGGQPLDCNDGNVCNGSETCKPGFGCQPGTPLVCDDANPCNGIESCAPGAGCQPGFPLSCSDNNSCTDDSCDPMLGCVHTNNQAPCEDANACTLDDQCLGGKCLPGEPLACNDGNLCTDDSCNPLQACVHKANKNPCDDGNPCSTDGCEPAAGCTHASLLDKTPCDPDGTCKAGVCVPNPPLDCNALHKKQPALPSGTYDVDPDGVGGKDPFQVYCDMTTDGGGWTLLAKFVSNLELHIFNPHKHQVQAAVDGANLAEAPALWKSDVWGHLAFNLFPVAGRELRMRCRSGPAANWFTTTFSNLFSDWNEGDKGSYGAGAGWGVLRWTTGRSSHWVCGLHVGSKYPGMAYCAGPGVGGYFTNHRVSISFDPNMGYGGGTAIGCNGSGIDIGKSGQYQAEVWLR